MSRIVLYIAMSLDGYIADRTGGVEWLGGDGSDADDSGSYPEFIKTIDTVVLGYTTYHQLKTELSPDLWPYEDKNTYVLTHRPMKDTSNIFFTDKKLKELLTELQREEKGDIWICGGASIVQQAVDADMIDIYTITVIPTILGDGVRLFGERNSDVKLKLLSTETYNGMIDLVYARR